MNPIQEPPTNGITDPNIHTDIRELSNAVIYALRSKQLSVAHVLGGIINERIIEKEHYIEETSIFFSPEEKAKHEAILDTLVDVMIMLNDLEWIAEKDINNA